MLCTNNLVWEIWFIQKTKTGIFNLPPKCLEKELNLLILMKLNKIHINVMWYIAKYLGTNQCFYKLEKFYKQINIKGFSYNKHLNKLKNLLKF